MKARQIEIDATILFADLRGYTGLSQSRSQGAISEILDAFYDECAEAIWERDGIVNKTMGDAIMAVFNFPINRDDHAAQAVRAARALQERWRKRRELLSKSLAGDDETVGVGVGIDSGRVNFGEFGRAHHDLTAIRPCKLDQIVVLEQRADAEDNSAFSARDDRRNDRADELARRAFDHDVGGGRRVQGKPGQRNALRLLQNDRQRTQHVLPFPEAQASSRVSLHGHYNASSNIYTLCAASALTSSGFRVCRWRTRENPASIRKAAISCRVRGRPRPIARR